MVQSRAAGERAPAGGVRKPVPQILLAAGVLALAGCATVTRGTHEPFHIASKPAGAQVQLSSGETCVTPCTLELPRGAPFAVRVLLSGYAGQVVQVASHGSAGGALGFVGNGLIGGIVGAGSDADNGSMRSLSPNPLVVRLEPIPSAPAASPASAMPAQSVTAVGKP